MGRDPPKDQEYFECPFCGARVRQGALACPECGSDEETGWSSAAYESEAELPDPEADDEDLLDQQDRQGHLSAVGAHAADLEGPPEKPPLTLPWPVVVLLILLLAAAAFLAGRFK